VALEAAAHRAQRQRSGVELDSSRARWEGASKENLHSTMATGDKARGRCMGYMWRHGGTWPMPDGVADVAPSDNKRG
jgi:hypothetical protein